MPDETPPTETYCEACGLAFNIKEDSFIDPNINEIFGYHFCNEECRDWFIESK